MTLDAVVLRRLQICIEVVKGEKLPLHAESKLGDEPIELDDVYIKGQLIGYLSGDQVGFRDLLQQQHLAPADADGSTTLNELTATILDKSSVKTREAYEARMLAHVWPVLQRLVAQLSQPPVAAANVLRTRPASDYVPATRLDDLRKSLDEELAKYLIGGDVSLNDLSGTLDSANAEIVLQMLA